MKTKIFLLAALSINIYSMSFKEAFDIASQSNQKIDEKEMIYKSSLEGIKKSQAQRLPQVNFKSTLQRENIDSSSIGDIRISNNKINSLTITAPLYNIALENEVKKSKFTSNIRQLELKKTSQEVVLEVARKYIPWLNFAQQKILAIKNFEFLDQHNKKMSKLLELNLISKGDFLESSTMLFEARLQKKFAFDTYEKSKKSLELFLKTKLKEHKDIIFDISNLEQSLEDNSLEKFLSRIEQNIDLSITNYEKETKYIDYDTQKKSFYPKVDFSSDFSKTSRSDDTFYNRYSGQVVLSMPLYTSGYNTAAKQEAQYMYMSLKNKEEYLKDDLKYTITQTYIELKRVLNIYL
jgi:outer membrane protein TolC